MRRVLVSAALIALFACVGRGATPPAAFDAVSVKPFVPSGPSQRIPEVGPQRLYIEGMTPRSMIVFAYGINYNQIAGLPDWAQRDLFQVVGVTDKPVTRAQMLVMLQNVLSTRFQFSFSETNAVQPVEALVVSAGGVKFKPSTSASDCANGVISLDRIRDAKLPPDATSPFAGCRISDLVKAFNVVSGLFGGRPVVDETGLTGKYSLFFWESTDDCQSLADGERCDPVEMFRRAVKRGRGLDLIKATAPYRVMHTIRIARPAANQ